MGGAALLYLVPSNVVGWGALGASLGAVPVTITGYSCTFFGDGQCWCHGYITKKDAVPGGKEAERSGPGLGSGAGSELAQ